MYFPRYGKPSVSALAIVLIGPLTMLAVSVIVISMSGDDAGLFAAIACLSVGIIVCILYPFTEQFAIVGDKIRIKKMFLTEEKKLPPKFVVVFAQADIHDPISHQSYFIKGKLSITILSSITAKEVLEILHSSKASKQIYTNSSIVQLLPHNYIYSFVYNKISLEKLARIGSYSVIIPESAKDKVNLVDDVISNAIVDFGW